MGKKPILDYKANKEKIQKDVPEAEQKEVLKQYNKLKGNTKVNIGK